MDIQLETEKFSDDNFTTEVNIRGRYMRFSVQVESLIMRNITLLHEEQSLARHQHHPLELERIVFKEKVGQFHHLLEYLHYDLAKQYSALFSHLHSFRRMRNIMAHCNFTFDPKDPAHVTIWKLDASRNRFEPVRYAIAEIFDLLKNSINHIIGDLNALSVDLEKRLRFKLPQLFE